MTSDRRNGLIGNAAIKVPCVAATTAAITLSGNQTIDGIACVTGDRVLVKNQASGIDNGIYIVDTGAWTRAPDFDGTYDAVEGTLVLVTSGAIGGDLVYQQTTASPVIGTSSLAFSSVLSISSFPISIALGGTGSSTAIAARVALQLEATRADIASATTLDLDATLTHSLNVTGTTATTGITLADGAYRILRANAAWPITHGASLICPGSASYTCAAGDLILAIGEPAGVVRLAIWKADGTAVVSSFNAAAVTGIGNGRSTDITISSAGEVTMPLQPAFLAYNSATDANVTGDNTSYTVICDTEVFDQNGDYNAGTGVFTAPVTGRYRFTFRVLLAELAAAHVTQNISIIASNRAFNIQDIFPGGANPFTQRQFEINCLVDMDSGDTAYPTVQISGGTKVVDVYGGASNNFTSFMGELVA